MRASDGCLMAPPAHTHLSDLAAAGGGKPAGDCCCGDNRMKSGRTCQRGRDGRAVGAGGAGWGRGLCPRVVLFSGEGAPTLPGCVVQQSNETQQPGRETRSHLH